MMIQVRPRTRPIPIAKALNTEISTASTDTIPLMKKLFQSFSGKLTRCQKLAMPSK